MVGPDITSGCLFRLYYPADFGADLVNLILFDPYNSAKRVENI